MAVYGIDLGTTYSCIAKLDNTGRAEIITDYETEQDIIASAVFVMADGQVLVGDGAKEEGVADPKRLCQFFKRYIGRTDLPNRQRYIIDGKEYDPIELSSIVLGRIKQYAKSQHEDVQDVVITCPAYFSYAQRDATKQAGMIAGMNVMCVVNEPTAAAVNYCVNQFDEDKTALVYDLGGGTFDVTLVKMTMQDGARNVEVLATDGDDMLGGADWDKALFDLILTKYVENYGGSIEKVPSDLKSELRGLVEATKKKLTNKESHKLKAQYEGEKIVLDITREEFESETQQYLSQTFLLLDNVLAKSGCSDSDIDVVLLVGGSTKMPMVQKAMNERYGEKVQFSDPDKAVAKGAAYIANMKQKGENAKMLSDIQQQIEKGEVKVVVGEGGKVQIVDVETHDVITEVDAPDISDISSPETTFVPGQQLSAEEFATMVAPAAETNDFIVQDVIPRTFGIVVGVREPDGSISLACDNIVHKDEKVPCSYERTYYTPSDNAERIRLPVIESLSEGELDPVGRDELTGELIFSNPDLDMQQRNQLILPVPAGLPRGSEILVEFSIDELGNVTLKATEKSSGTSETVKFNFSNAVSEAQLQEMQAAQDNRLYAMDI